MAELYDLSAALDAFDVYQAGEAPDGTIFFTRDPRVPIDDTVVWIGSDPSTTMTVVEAEARFGEVVWLMEPELVVESAQVAAAAAPTLDEVPVVDPVASEVDETARLALIGEVETRVGQLEAMIADLILDSVADAAFVDGSPDVVVEVEDQQARAAAVGIPESLGDLTGLCARLAAMEPVESDDVATRLEAVMERLTALEEQISTLMEDDVRDEKMPDEDTDEDDEDLPDEDAGVTVDETARTAGAAVLNNLRRVRRGQLVDVGDDTYLALGSGQFRAPGGKVFSAEQLGG